MKIALLVIHRLTGFCLYFKNGKIDLIKKVEVLKINLKNKKYGK
ncbi:MAG: hypothetical protein CEN87_560 [Parcubacteria group bacterium Licking1014_1]|nr:MAG: hypothetical protein CEN87_560 [Parcubacteria group bacterium Licking1014_1]